MNVAKKDWIFIAVIAALLGALFVSTVNKKAKNVPYDEKHSRFHEVTHRELDRAEAEKKCTACHGTGNIPLSKAHPPKEQCLLCHRLVRF